MILVARLRVTLIVILRVILIATFMVVWDRGGGKGEDNRGKKRREERITERGRRDNRSTNMKN